VTKLEIENCDTLYHNIQSMGDVWVWSYKSGLTSPLFLNWNACTKPGQW